ncbi:Gp37-like protein [Mogibacterium timidum]
MIQFFDKFMNRLEDMDFIEVAWNRKWREPGDFSVYLAAKDWNRSAKFVKNNGRPETGIIQKTVYEVTPQGAMVTLSGFFAEHVLSGVAIFKDENVNDEGAIVTYGLFGVINYSALGQYSENEQIVELHDMPPSVPGMVWGEYETEWMPRLAYSFKAGTDAATALYDICNIYDMGWYVTLGEAFQGGSDFVSEWMKKIKEPHYLYTVRPLRGRNLKDKVYFGAGWDNVSKIEYVYDDSGVYSIVEARQTMEETGFTKEEIITDESGNRKGRIQEFYVDQSNCPKDLDLYPRKIIEGNVSGIELKVANESVIREQLRNQCKLEMLNHWKQETINVDVLQNTYYYLKDYDLGDTCTIVLDDIEQMFTARIMEVKEVWRKNAVEIQLVFGTPFKQKYIALNL